MPDLVRDQPLIAIDVVPLAFDRVAGLLIGTATRAFDPFAGSEALPGVLLGPSELLVAAASRALDAKAGIRAAEVRHLAQLGAFDGPGRDPRSRAISVAFVAVTGPDAGSATLWTPAASGALDLPFDHDAIIAVAREHVRTRLWSDVPLTRALTGDTFSTAAGSALEAELTGLKPHAGNFHRGLSKHPGLERLDSTAATGGRPATSWRWR
ncbi:ADP-ribose pyrophosphatase [Frondihabitans sucicola]|uniref:ADP-ribose pyrophosphatase n=1 Tax=Frondihabitans sucicola TaxID=1268041 RepID=A0ABN6XVC7_9MICO|nr:NUDIX hydrolase [Frondihabitans sucicola]BDZ48987.1 ADP-ribose pyrophosphatase [Frondihabitans sucicola]